MSDLNGFRLFSLSSLLIYIMFTSVVLQSNITYMYYRDLNGSLIVGLLDRQTASKCPNVMLNIRDD